jgi:hypothetical protein
MIVDQGLGYDSVERELVLKKNVGLVDVFLKIILAYQACHRA